MASTFKGEVLSLEKIPLGQPIEITDFSVFHESTTRNLNISKPVFGIITGLRDDPNKSNLKYPGIKVWDGKNFNETYFYSKNYNRSTYTGFGMDLSTQALKLLTGTKARLLMNDYRKSVIATGNLPFTNIIWTSGADPEIFVVNEKDDVIPAWEFLPEKAKAVGAYYQTEKAFWDGYQAEYTITAGGCLAYAVDSMQRGLKTVHNAAIKYNPKAKLTIRNVLPVSEESLASAAEAHVTFGCKPSLNAYGTKATPITNPRHIPFRFAGGHIHLGNTLVHGNIEETVKMLDALVGVWAVGAFAKIDSPVRRRFYGLAGEYRKPYHGVEYRTLSNAWLCHPGIAHCVYDMSRYVAALGYSNMRKVLITETEDKIQKIINNCDVKEARKMVDKYKAIYLKMSRQRYYQDDAGKVTLHIAQNGVESLLDPEDLTKNWELNGTWTTHSEGAGKNFNRFSTLMGNKA